MKKNVKYILFAMLIIAAAATAFYINTTPLSVDIITVAPTDIQTWFIEDGTTKSAEDYNIISNVSGKVREVFVSDRDFVEEGTLIAQIDTQDYLTNIETHKSNIEGYYARIAEETANEQNTKDSYLRSIEELKAKLAQAESKIKIDDISTISVLPPNEQIKMLELSIEQCRSELEYDKNKYESNLTLFQSGAISSEELKDLEQKYNTTQTEMERLEEEKASLKREIDRLNGLYPDDNLNALNETAENELNEAILDEIKGQIAAMEKEAAKDYKTNAIQNLNALISIEESAIKSLEDDVSDCNIVAERTGTISRLPIMNESSIYEGTLLCTIKEGQTLSVESYVSTEDVVHIAIGDNVELIQKTREDDLKYAGTVTKIEDWAEEKVSALGIIENKVKITIEIDGAIETLGGGYDVDVKYFTFDGKNRIVLPKSALYRYNDEDFVFIVERTDESKKEGMAKAIPVKTGQSTNTEIVVLEGLKDGDTVIKNAASKEITEETVVRWSD